MTGDTAGVPLSARRAMAGESWSPEDFDVAEWVCRPHTFHYGLEGGLSRMRVWSEVDQPTQKVIALARARESGRAGNRRSAWTVARALRERSPHVERLLDR